MGLMLRGLLKNIDGEALKWAFNKMNKRKEDRKILMVILMGLLLMTRHYPLIQVII